MPKIRIEILLIMCLAVAVTVAFYHSGYMTGYIGAHKDYISKQYASSAEKEIEDRCLPLNPVAKANCIRQVIEATHEYLRTERDVAAQEGMELWAYLMVIISFLALILTAVGVWFIWRTMYFTRLTLDEAKETNKAAWATVEETVRIGEAQVRAYLSVLDGRIEYTSGSNPVLYLTIENTGQSPAFNVFVSAKYSNSHVNIIDETSVDREIPIMRNPVAKAIPSRIREEYRIASYGDSPYIEGQDFSPLSTIEGIIEYQSVFGSGRHEVEYDATFLIVPKFNKFAIQDGVKRSGVFSGAIKFIRMVQSKWIDDYIEILKSLHAGKTSDPDKAT